MARPDDADGLLGANAQPGVAYDEDGRVTRGGDGCNGFEALPTSDTMDQPLRGCEDSFPRQQIVSVLVAGEAVFDGGQLLLSTETLQAGLVPQGAPAAAYTASWQQAFGDRYDELEQLTVELSHIEGLRHVVGLSAQRVPAASLTGTAAAVEQATAVLARSGYAADTADTQR